jgi:hypothetical protein
MKTCKRFMRMNGNKLTFLTLKNIKNHVQFQQFVRNLLALDLS